MGGSIMSLRDQLRAAAPLASKEVELSNGKIRVYELDAKGRALVLDYLNQVIKLQNSGEIKSNHYAILTLSIVCHGLRDAETLKPEFEISNQTDRDELMSLGDTNLMIMHDAICELSGLEHLTTENRNKDAAEKK